MRSAISSVSGGLVAAALLGSVPCEHAFGQVFTWSNGAGGSWSTGANWNPVGVPDNAGESALINLGGTFTITLTGSQSPDSVQLLSTGATLDIANNSFLNIGAAAGLVNDGVVRVNATAGFNFTALRFGVPAPLSGSGTVRLNAAPSNLLTSYIETVNTGIVQHKAPHTIAGTGRIQGRVENEGLIVADIAGATLEINGILMQTGAGTLRADPGILSLGSGAEVSGGTITGANAGSWSVTSNPSISNVTSTLTGTVLNNSTLRVLSGGFTNHATLHVNSGAGANFTRIRIEEACWFSGNGNVNLRSSDNLDTAYIEGAAVGSVLSQATSHSITGSGRIYATTVNNGTVRATIPGRPLEIRGQFTQGISGFIIGDNADAALGSGSQTSGGAFKTVGTGRVRVTGDATVGGIANLGLLTVDNNALLRLANGSMNNSGAVAVNTTAGGNFTRIRLEAPYTIFGAGSINLNAASNLDTAYIESALPTAELTQISDHSIRGTGRIYAAMQNFGDIRADVPGKVLEVRGTITQIATGKIEGNPGIAGLGASAVITGGSFSSGAGGVVRSTGNCSVGGVANIGMFQIGNNTRVGVLGAGIINNGQIEINDGVGGNFTSLVADAPATINGSGTLTLRAAANPDLAYIDGQAFGLTNGFAHTITGNGRLYGKLGNQGTIRGSETPGEIVRVRGELTQTGAGKLVGHIGAVGLDSGTVNGGTFESLGGPVRAVAGTSNANSVENKGQFVIDNNARVNATSLINNGTITVNGTAGNNFTTLNFPGVQSLTGIGQIVLNAGPNLDSAFIEATGVGSVLTVGSGQTIRGTGRLYASLVSDAQLAPGLTVGAIGRLEPRGPAILGTLSHIEMDITGDDPGQFDVIASNSTLALAGSMNLSISGWTPTDPCTSLTLISASAITGEFESVTLDAPPPPGDRVWRLDYEPTRVSLRLTCPSDLNGDCVVDDRDFTKFVGAYNLLDCADPAMPQNCPADLNFDGVVDDADFVIWLVAYNQLLCAE